MLINVQLQVDGPITQMDESELIKATGGIDNEVERTTWIEYRLKSDPENPRAVHRSVDMCLKTNIFCDAVAASF